MSYYGLVGKFTAQPGKQAQLVDILLKASELLKANKDCHQYIIGTNDEPDTIWVSEGWTNKAAHDASLEPEDVRALISRARPLIASMGNGTELVIAGGKGL